MRYTHIRWGMIGVGDVTQRKSAPSFNKIENSSLVAVGSRTAGKAERYAAENGVARFHADPYKVITDPEVDAVYIATPPGSHLEYALSTIAAGKPVYIEKPMALNYDECVRINEAAAAKKLRVYVAYYRRSLEYFKLVKKLLDEGKAGRILSLHIDQHFTARAEDHDRQALPWRVRPEISGGGYFHDVGCHALDIIFFLLGDPVKVHGSAANLAGLYEPEDSVTALLQLQGNILMSGNWSFIVPAGFARDRVMIIGDKGRLSFSIFSFEPILLETADGSQSFTAIQPEHIQMPFIQTIVEELTGKGTCPSTGVTAAVTSKAMDEILGKTRG